VTVLRKVTVTSLFDPLAQTFTLSEGRMIGGVSVNFCSKGGANAGPANGVPWTQRNSVIVQIRTTQVGFPTSEVLAEAIIPWDDIKVGLPYAQNWTTAHFTPPVTLQADKEYCIVLLTDDPYHAVAIASLGQFVSAGNGREGWVTEQAYQIGTLLSSGNAVTWTAHQNDDMAFRLLGCKFTANTRTVDLGTVTADQASDFRPMATVFRPSAEADLKFSFTPVASGELREGYEDQSIELPARVTDTVVVKAHLQGSEKWSPVLYPDMQVLLGNIGELDDYITRGIQAATLFNASLKFDVLKSGGSNIRPFLEVARTVSGVDQNGPDGQPLTDFLPMNLTASAPIGDGWVEETYTLNGLRGVGLERLTALKLEVSGNTGNRPYGRKVRLTLK
jgi:hypothetical protein